MFRFGKEHSFEEKVLENITNELGRIMVKDAVVVVVIQFRKFMALSAFEILRRMSMILNPNEFTKYKEEKLEWYYWLYGNLKSIGLKNN